MRELNEILFSENDEEKLRIGEEFFYKLGYGTNMGALDNELFYNEPTNLYLLIINIIFLSLFLCFLVLFFIFKKGASWILELSNDIQRITFKSGYKYRNDILNSNKLCLMALASYRYIVQYNILLKNQLRQS